MSDLAAKLNDICRRAVADTEAEPRMIDLLAAARPDVPLVLASFGIDAIRSAAILLALLDGAAAMPRFTVDLVAEARAGRIDPIRGRDAEIGQVIDILLRRRQNNPILVGDAGVGKTAVAEGFAMRVAAGDVPPPLRGISVLALDLGALQAGAGVKGEFEERLKSVIAEARNAVLFVDEAHALIGADAANLLKPALARGELRTIAATTWSEYKRTFENDAALARRFQLVKVEEPREEAALEMLRGIAPLLERHHGIEIADDAVRAAVRLSHRYLPERRLPDKAIGVLDTAAARVALARHVTPSVSEGPGRTCGAPPEPPGPSLTLGVTEVAEVIAAWTGIPAGRMLADDARGILGLHDRLSERIVGQPKALDAICRRLATAHAGLEDPAKPRGVFLLCGPTGVGKTETALALADALYGGERNLVAFNMSEFGEPHSVATLKGAPPGYVGYGRGGALTEAVRRRPWCAVLLDEFEKAHRDVADLFLQVFDKGVLEDGDGVPVDFRNTVIVLTSNAGPEHLRPALLARVTVVPYERLSHADVLRIVELKLRAICSRLRESHSAELTYDPRLIDSLAAECDAGRGAREVDRVLTESLLPEISTRILKRMAGGVRFATIHISVDAQGRFV